MKLLRNSPFQSKKLLLVGMVSLFGLIHGSASISHQMISAIILFLGENSSKALSQRRPSPTRKVSSNQIRTTPERSRTFL